MYVSRGPRTFSVNVDANAHVVRHLVDLLSERPLTAFPATIAMAQSKAGSSQSKMSEQQRAIMCIKNLRSLLGLLSDFACPAHFRQIAIAHYEPFFHRCPWDVLAAAADKPDYDLARTGIVAMGRQRPNYSIQIASDGVKRLEPEYPDWRPWRLSVDQVKTVPVEWYVLFVRVVGCREAAGGSAALVPLNPAVSSFPPVHRGW